MFHFQHPLDRRLWRLRLHLHPHESSRRSQHLEDEERRLDRPHQHAPLVRHCDHWSAHVLEEPQLAVPVHGEGGCLGGRGEGGRGDEEEGGGMAEWRKW